MKRFYLLGIFVAALSCSDVVELSQWEVNQIEIKKKYPKIRYALDGEYGILFEDGKSIYGIDGNTINIDGGTIINVFSSTRNDNLVGRLGININNSVFYDVKTDTYPFQDEPQAVENFYSVFGKNVGANIENGVFTVYSENLPAGMENLYVPEMLKANVDNLSNWSIVSGSAIHWNKDVNNKSGVFIIVSYSPSNQPNPDMSKAYPDNRTWYFKIEDTGNFIFTKDFLSNFPNDASMDFSIERIAHSIGKYGLNEDTAFTVCSSIFFSSYLNY